MSKERLEIGDCARPAQFMLDSPWHAHLCELVLLVIDIGSAKGEEDTLVKLIRLDGVRAWPERAEYQFLEYELEKIS